MTTNAHAARIVLLMGCAAAWLGWLSTRTDIIFADGLRYIAQAQRLDAGSISDGLKQSVDHPAYPLGIVAAHRWFRGSGPESWQFAAQVASIAAAVLLIVPLYLVALELFGASSAWLACVLAFLVPQTGHVFADTLSESTFLLFWTWGVWAALRFLRDGSFGWLPLTIAFAALAYLSRPEGLLLPAGLVATLALMPLLRSTRLVWPRWWAAVGLLVVGPALLVGPYVAMRGGISTKPAVGRLLGLAAKSPALAVERERPLDPDQSTAKTYGLAVKAVVQAVRGAVTLPLLILAPIGLFAVWRLGARPRQWLFVGIVLGAALLALVRLQATGGYCSPRHAMVVAFPLFAAAALGLSGLMGRLAIPGRWIGQGEGSFTAGPAVWLLVLGGLAVGQMPDLTAPINHAFGGYREAGAYLAKNVPPDSPVIDVTGWSLYYGGRNGYTFQNLTEGTADRKVRWVVVRDAHLHGPWGYCHQLKELIGDRKPTETYPTEPTKGVAQVYVFDLATPVARAEAPPVR